MHPKRRKRDSETQMIKNIVTQFRLVSEYVKDDAELKAACELLKVRMMAIWEKKDAEVKALLVPVKYVITVAPSA